MKVWVNGELIDGSEASVSVFDAGIQHGIGLFETMQAKGGTIFRARAHMERLARSAKELLLSDRLHIDPLVDAAHLAVSENGLEDARVRLTLTGGNLGSPTTSDGHQDPTIFIVAQPPTIYPEAFFDQGVAVTIAPGRANPFSPDAGCKTLGYWSRIQALQVAAGQQAGESLWLTPMAHLASGSVSNLFLVADGVLRTPVARGEEEGDLPAPVLPGITRAAVIDLADDLGMGTQKTELTLDDLLEADEAFLTNSSWGVLPVNSLLAHARAEEGSGVQLHRRPIAEGHVGATTVRLRERLLALIEQETTLSGDGGGH